jgi:hypothetical protein
MLTEVVGILFQPVVSILHIGVCAFPLRIENNTQTKNKIFVLILM